MSQFAWSIIDPNVVSGTQLAALLNNGESALHSQHLGTIQPLYAVDGMIWVDNSNPALWQVNQMEGGAAVPLWQIDTATNAAVFPGAGGTAVWGGITGNIADQTDLQDSLALRLSTSGGSLTGTLNMNNNKIGGVLAPTVGNEAANKTYVDGLVGGAAWGNITGTLSNQTDLWASLSDKIDSVVGGQMQGHFGINNTSSLKFVGATGLEDIVLSMSNVFGGTVLNFLPDNNALAGYWFDTGGGEAIVMADGQMTLSTAASLTTNPVRKGEADADYAVKASEGTAVWGGITGTLSNQGDVQSALDAKLNLLGGTMTGALSMGGSKITNVANPTATGDAARKIYVDDKTWAASAITSGTFANARISESSVTQYTDSKYVNVTGNQAGIAGNKTWTGTHVFQGDMQVTGTSKFDQIVYYTVDLADTMSSVLKNDFGVYMEHNTGKDDIGWIFNNDASNNIVFGSGLVAGTAQPTAAQHLTRKDYVDGAISSGISGATFAASQVTSGVFVDARIPSLNASKTTAGTFANARISQSSVTQYQGNLTLAASQTTSGTFGDARIPSLATSKITSGTFANARISSGSITQYTAALYVGLTGNQTVNGVKTYGSKARFNSGVGIGAANSGASLLEVTGTAHFGESDGGIALGQFLSAGVISSTNRAIDTFTGMILQSAQYNIVTVDGSEITRAILDGGVPKFGIGTTAPVAPLHVYRAGSTFPAVIESDQTNAYLTVQASGTASGAQVGIGANVNNLIMLSGGAIKATLNTSGNLGIGITSPLESVDAAANVRARGRFLSANGSNGAPSYSFNGDSDTGMRRVAANTLSFITGASERGRISSAGFWGINNTAPIAPMHIGSGSGRAWSKNAATQAIIESSGVTMLSIIAGGTTNYSEINFGDTAAEIRGTVKYNHGSESFIFSVNGGYAYQMTPTTMQPNASNTFNLGASGFRWKTIYANNALNTSDATEKNDIKGLPDGMAETLLRGFGPVSYRWNHDGKKAKQNFGFIAQTVAKAISKTGKNPEDFGMLHIAKPDEVLGDTWGLDYNQVTPLLTDVVVKLIDRIEELEKWRSNSKP